jgi:hypothetical protein
MIKKRGFEVDFHSNKTPRRLFKLKGETPSPFSYDTKAAYEKT